MADDDKQVYYRNVTVRLSVDDDKRIRKAADARGISVAKYIETAANERAVQDEAVGS